MNEVSICNLALARIAHTDSIASLDEDTAAGRACKTVYAPSRDRALASFPWPFATRRATLAELTAVTRDGWEYAYALPADCLSPRNLWPGVRTPDADTVIPFRVEMNDAGTGKILLTDIGGSTTAVLTYTAAVTNAGLFPPLFWDALAWLLARELSMPLATKSDLAAAAEKMWRTSFSEACAQAQRESHEARATTPSVAIRG